MAKKKKSTASKSATPLSPKKYITTKARGLPIADSWISSEWEEDGSAEVIVVRKHAGGTFTVGLYLVDLWCLGIMKTSFFFNIGYDEYQILLEKIMEMTDLQPVDYDLAHTIVWGAMEFADEYEFNPHKDFAVTRYILESENAVERVDKVEFGVDGIAYFVCNPDPDKEVENQRVIHHLSQFDPDEYEIEWDDEEEDFSLGELKTYMKEIGIPTFLEFLADKNKEGGKLQPLQQEELDHIASYLSKIEEKKDIWPYRDEEWDAYEVLNNMDMGNPMYEETLMKLTGKYPNNPEIQWFLLSYYESREETGKVDEVAQWILAKAPTHFRTRFIKASNILREGKFFEEALHVYSDGNYWVNQLKGKKHYGFTDLEVFHEHLVLLMVLAKHGDVQQLYLQAVLLDKLLEVKSTSIMKEIKEMLTSYIMNELYDEEQAEVVFDEYKTIYEEKIKEVEASIDELKADIEDESAEE